LGPSINSYNITCHAWKQFWNLTWCALCRMFYGPGGPYAFFAGREASRALALMSFDPRDLNGNLEGLSEPELEVLQDWEYKFMEKYVKVGQLVGTDQAVNGGEVQESEKHDWNQEQWKLSLSMVFDGYQVYGSVCNTLL